MMTEHEKQLLTEDLCQRLPYGVKVSFSASAYPFNTLGGYFDSQFYLTEPELWTFPQYIKPFLRSTEEMTESELREYLNTMDKIEVGENIYKYIETAKTYKYLNSHHFDYRGLIGKGLAIKADRKIYVSE